MDSQTILLNIVFEYQKSEGMKKLIFALVLLSGIAGAGCKKEPLFTRKQIVGKWVLEKTGYESPIGSGEVISQVQADTYFIIFSDDGKLESNYIGPWTGTWEYKNGNFYTKRDGFDEFDKYGILHLNAQNMIHYFEIGLQNGEVKRYTEYYVKSNL